MLQRSFVEGIKNRLRGRDMRYIEIPIQVEGSQPDTKAEIYLLDTPSDKIKIQKRPMIIICPGGGYEKTSYREGEPLAMHFLNSGYHACVLRYSVKPAKYPTALLELGVVMKLAHEHAKDWKVDEKYILLHGASAGGHLAANLGVFWNQPWFCQKLETEAYKLKPAGILLSYPVITSNKKLGHLPSFRNLLGNQFEEMEEKLSLEKYVTNDMPPCFIWHTVTDQTVPVENSFLLAMALKEAGVSVELHIFPEGEHGLSLASGLVERADGTGIQDECAHWIELADAWIKNICKNNIKVRMKGD